MEQFNSLVEFRQAVYDHGLTRAKDAQFELVDALLLSPPIRSFPDLSLCPVFRRKWPSAYATIEDGQQDREWLESYFTQQIPRRGVQVFALDGTGWPHPSARTLAAPTPGRDFVNRCPASVYYWEHEHVPLD